MGFEGAFNGAATRDTPRLNFFCYWIGQIRGRGIWRSRAARALGVFISVPISFSVLAVWGGVSSAGEI